MKHIRTALFLCLLVSFAVLLWFFGVNQQFQSLKKINLADVPFENFILSVLFVFVVVVAFLGNLHSKKNHQSNYE